MLKVISSQAFDAVHFAAGTLIGAAMNMSKGTDDDDVSRAVELVRTQWLGVTAGELMAVAMALAFALDLLDGKAPRLDECEFTMSLLKSEAENLKALGLGGGAE